MKTDFAVDEIRESPPPAEKKYRVIEVETGCGYANVKDEYGYVRKVMLRELERWRLCDPDPLRDHAKKHGLRLDEKLPEPAPDYRTIVEGSEANR